MDIVVNSWFSEYLEASAEERQVELFDSFIKKLIHSDWKIVTINDAQLEKKLRRLEKTYKDHRDTRYIIKIKTIYRAIYLNSNKCKILPRPELSKELLAIFESDSNKEDDQFLFEAAIQTKEKVIVTTDKRLQNALNRIEGVTILLLEEFLDKY